MSVVVEQSLRDEIFKQLLTIHDQVSSPDGYPYDPNNLRAVLRAVIIGDFPSVRMGRILNVFMKVDYEKNVRELVDEGRYDGVDPNFVYSPVSRNHEGVHKVELLLRCFDCKMTPGEVEFLMKRTDFLPARHHEILTLGIKRPELQIQFPIISTATMLEGPNGARFGIKLDSEEEKPRTLGGVFLNKQFPPHYWFAGMKTLD